jgi:predicted RNA binding protein YcfA (HicA-like mRNA interferase family)
MGEREDFLRELRVLARKKGLFLVIDAKQGKGSHYKVWVGDQQTTIPAHLKPPVRKGILKQLGLDKV